MWNNDYFDIYNISSNMIANQSRALSAAYIYQASHAFQGYAHNTSAPIDGDIAGVIFYLCYEGTYENITCTIGLLNLSDPSQLAFDWLPIPITPSDSLSSTSLRNCSGPLSLFVHEANITEGISSLFAGLVYVEYYQNSYSFQTTKLNQRNSTNICEYRSTPLSEGA